MDSYMERPTEKIPVRLKPYARQIGKWPEGFEIKDHKKGTKYSINKNTTIAAIGTTGMRSHL
jgi:hypothetical protein